MASGTPMLVAQNSVNGSRVVAYNNDPEAHEETDCGHTNTRVNKAWQTDLNSTGTRRVQHEQEKRRDSNRCTRTKQSA